MRQSGAAVPGPRRRDSEGGHPELHRHLDLHLRVGLTGSGSAMSVHLLFLIVGLGLGALYASLALGLVVVFKGTGVVNFAQGAMAMWAAFVYDEIRKTGDLVFVV